MKKYIFFCNASNTLGLGHLSRSYSIASKIDSAKEILFGINKDEIAVNFIKHRFDYDFMNFHESPEKFMLRLVTKYKPLSIVIDSKHNYSRLHTKQIKKHNVKIVFY